MVTGKEIHTQRNRFFMAFLEKSRKECVKIGLAHEKTSYLQEKANLFEIGSVRFIFLFNPSTIPLLNCFFALK